MAACTTVVAGQVVSCAGPTAGNQTFTPTVAPWLYTLDDLAGTTVITGGAGNSGTAGNVVITNTSGGIDRDGQVTIEANTTIQNGTGIRPGLVINNTAAAPTSTVGITMDGTITTLDGNADGIRLVGGFNYNLNIGATGVITAGDDGVVVSAASGHVAINNAGSITVTGTSGSAANLSDGILIAQGGAPGSQIAGSATVINTGTIAGFTAGDPANGGAGISVSATGAIIVQNNGTANLNAHADGGNFGIFARGSSTIDITNAANIGVAGGLISHAGIDAANTTSALNITNSGQIGTGLAPITGLGINALSTTGAITVHNSGSVFAGSHGIQIASTSGNVIVSNTSDTTIVAGTDGINVTTAGTVDAINSGAIGSLDGSVRVGGTGIFINATSGTSTVTVSDDGTGLTPPGDIGGSIFATTNGIQVQDGTTVGITLQNSTVDALNGNAIHVRGGNGATTITLGQNMGGGTSTDLAAGNNAIDVVRNGAASPITVNTFGGIITAGNIGMNLSRTSFSSGGITVLMDRGTDLTATNTGLNIARTGGSGGVGVTLDRNSSVTSTAGDGINIAHTLNSGGVGVLVDRGSSVSGLDDGMNIVQTLSGGGTAVTVDRGGSIAAGNDGLNIVQTLSSGGVTVTLDRGGSVDSTVAGNGVNIVQTLSSGGVTMLLDRGGSVETTDGTGVLIASTLSTGPIGITLDRGGRVIANGGDGFDISRIGGTGGVTVTLDRGGRIIADDGSAIRALTAGGAAKNIEIVNDSYLRGNGLGGNSTIVASANGDFSFTNDANGLIETAGSNFRRIIDAEGQSVMVWNDGTMNGNMALTSTVGNIAITNNSSNTWNWAGINTFNSADSITFDNTATGTANAGPFSASFFNSVNDSTINNDGVFNITGLNAFIFNAGGLATVNNSNLINVTGLAGFFGLDDFNNNALLSMANGNSGFGGGVFVPGFGSELGDLTIIGGNFNGALASQIALDARLAGTTDSASDLTVVTGATGGMTGLVVMSGNGPGAYNPVGIPVVSVTSGNTAFGHFFIDPTSNNYTTKSGQGVIDKGAFFYAHALVPSPNIPGGMTHVLVGLPDAEAFQFAYVATGAQNLWHETAGGWLDKQNDLRRRFFGNLAGSNQAGSGADLPRKAPAARVAEAASASGFGNWIKAIGSHTKRSDVQSVPGFATFTFDTSYKQTSYGLMGGIDWTQHTPVTTAQIGVMGGYVDSELKFDSATAPTTFKYRGGMAGVSATYMHHGFFVDALFKADFLTVDINMSSLAPFGASSASVDVTNIGGLGNIGHRFNMGPAYMEAIATLAYVSTKVGSTTLQGMGVAWDDGKSFRGGIGGRVGSIVHTSATHVVDASILGRVWNEWEANNVVSLVTTGPGLSLADGAAKNKLFGEVAGSIDVANRAWGGWSGFVNGGAKFNSDFTTVTGKGGVRYQW